MSKIVEFAKHSPRKIRDTVPWGEVKSCIVIYEGKEGHAVLHISDMLWKDRVWLTGELINFNSAQSVVDLLERDNE